MDSLPVFNHETLGELVGYVDDATGAAIWVATDGSEYVRDADGNFVADQVDEVTDERGPSEFDHVPTVDEVRAYYGTKITGARVLERIDERCIRFGITWSFDADGRESWSDWCEYHGKWSLGAD